MNGTLTHLWRGRATRSITVVNRAARLDVEAGGLFDVAEDHYGNTYVHDGTGTEFVLSHLEVVAASPEEWRTDGLRDRIDYLTAILDRPERRGEGHHRAELEGRRDRAVEQLERLVDIPRRTSPVGKVRADPLELPARDRAAAGRVGDRDERFLVARPEAHHVVVCTDDTGLTWVLARTVDGIEDPLFFGEAQAQRIAEAIDIQVVGTTATAAEWFAADTATPGDAVDRIVAVACGGGTPSTEGRTDGRTRRR